MTISSYERLFGIRTLAGLVETFAREDAMSRAAMSLFQGSARRVDPLVDGSFEWDEVQFSRHLAPFVGRDAPAVRVTGLNKIVRSSAPAHIRTSKWIGAHRLHGDRGPGSLLPNASMVVDMELRDQAKTIGNSKEYLAMGALFGTVTVNGTTVPGTTAPFTLSFGLNTYTATSDWSVASSPLLQTELPALKLDYMQAIGLQGRQALIGSTIGGYLRGNSDVTNLLAAQYGVQMVRSAAELFSPAAFEGLEIGGIRWTVTEEGYVPEGGSFTRYIPATDKGVLLPESGDLADVLGLCEGYGLVPSSGGPVVPVAGAAFSVGPAPSRGNYSYAIQHLNPLGVELIQGWCGLCVILTPNGVVVFDVVP